MKKIIKLSFLFLLVFILTGCGKLLQVKKQITIEYGHNIPGDVKEYLQLDKINEDKRDDIIQNTKIDILDDYVKEEHPTIGTYTVQLTYQKEKERIIVEVKDTTKPTFVDFKDTIETYKDVPIDLTKAYQVKDLSKVIIEVDENQIDYTKEGTYKTTITATDESQNKETKTIQVIVKKPEIILKKTNISLNKGQSETITPTINGKENTAKYQSSNPHIVSIDENGKMIAKKNGKATITIIANGVEAKCEITVKEKVIQNSDYVKVKDCIPSLYVDLKYATKDNFTKQVIYNFKEAYLRYGTVKKLKKAQNELLKQGYSIKIWDGYRPFDAQKAMWNVVSDSRYVANPNKGPRNHNLGGTVDVTLVKKDGTYIPMPTEFDDFSKRADRDYSDITDQKAIQNVKILERAMKNAGFSGYKNEWWHYNDTVKYQFVDYKPK